LRKDPTMKHRLSATVVLVVGALASSLVGAVASRQATPATKLTLAVLGDVPYSSAQLAAFPGWVDQINRAPQVGVVVHLGDIKSGETRCDDSYYRTIAQLFDSFDDPVVYTPGDNEWTDCHHPEDGGYNPLERLARIRA